MTQSEYAMHIANGGESILPEMAEWPHISRHYGEPGYPGAPVYIAACPAENGCEFYGMCDLCPNSMEDDLDGMTMEEACENAGVAIYETMDGERICE